MTPKEMKFRLIVSMVASGKFGSAAEIAANAPAIFAAADIPASPEAVEPGLSDEECERIAGGFVGFASKAMVRVGTTAFSFFHPTGRDEAVKLVRRDLVALLLQYCGRRPTNDGYRKALEEIQTVAGRPFGIDDDRDTVVKAGADFTEILDISRKALDAGKGEGR